ncbi:MAG: hypothetical protein ACYDCH_02620 [Gaiellaceae bacterium]
MTPEQRRDEARAIEQLKAAYDAMNKAAGDNKVKKLYAAEILDILRRLRGDHDAA